VEFVQKKQRADRIRGLPYLFNISQNAISVKPLRRKSPEKARKSAKIHCHKFSLDKHVENAKRDFSFPRRCDIM
jgi:hypothetical protein